MCSQDPTITTAICRLSARPASPATTAPFAGPRVGVGRLASCELKPHDEHARTSAARHEPDALPGPHARSESAAAALAAAEAKREGMITVALLGWRPSADDRGPADRHH